MPRADNCGPIALARKCASGPNVGKPRGPYGTHTQPVGFIHTCGTRPTLGKVSYPVWGFWCTAGGLSMGLPTIYCGARTYPIHYNQGVIMGISTIYCGAQTYPILYIQGVIVGRYIHYLLWGPYWSHSLYLRGYCGYIHHLLWGPDLSHTLYSSGYYG